MAAPNLLNLTTITAGQAVANLTTSATALITNAAASGKSIKVNSVIVGNVDGTNAATFDLYITRSATNYYISKVVNVPAASSLIAISKDASFYLLEGDVLSALASVASDLDISVAYETLE